MRREQYAVIGDPIDHSLSPRMQAAAFRAAGLHAEYEAIRVRPRDLPDAVMRLRTSHFAGFNVTIPHKEAIQALLDSVTSLARTVGAVNTVTRDHGALVGHNTDVPGFLAALDRMYDSEPGDRAVVFGTGGAARAVVCGLVSRGLSVTVMSRSRSKPFTLTAAGPGAYRVLCRDDVDSVAEIEDARVVINATPAGMPSLSRETPLPDDLRLRRDMVMMDLVYGQTTPFLQRGMQAGCRAVDGLEMLVWQGAFAFKLWTGIAPDIDVMRHACRDRLGKDRTCSVS